MEFIDETGNGQDHPQKRPLKTRNLSIFEYLTELQVEYVEAELRKKIYPSRKDREFYKRVMGWKEQKIRDISLRNQMPTIFDNHDEKERIYMSIYPSRGGFPNFQYKDNGKENPMTGRKEVEELRENDSRNYYMQDSEVKVYVGENEFEVGTLVSFDGMARVCVVKLRHDSDTRTVHSGLVARIL